MKKNWHLILLGLIILAVFFIRAYNFHNWLYFEADQARNAKNSVEAIDEGIMKLPLLGPKAGGTDFHLGPISYYFEYVSGLVFGIDSPEVFAFSNFFFLLLTIPLFFYFLRMFFPKGLSLLITSLFSFSYIVTQYARFSWNPNAIIFWGLLFLISIYKVSIEKDRKKAGLWLLLAALGYGVSSQLHTLSLLGFPLVALFFWFFYHPVKINWKYWIGAFLVVMVLYSPLIIYDINNNGHNTKEFIKAFSAKSEHRTIPEKVEKTVEQYGKYYSMIIFSVNDKEFKDINYLSYLIILATIILMGFYWKKGHKEKEFNFLPRSFFILISVWFLIFLFLDYMLAFDIDQPRFWFPTFFLPYIFLAMLAFSIWKYKIGKILVISIGTIIIILNLLAILNWYEGMKNQDEQDRFGRKITSTSLIQNDFIAFGNMEKSVDWIIDDSQKSKNSICFNSPSTYLASYKFVFDRRYPDFDVKRINKTIEMGLVDDCDIYIIDHGSNPKKEIEEKFSKKGISIKLKEGTQLGLINIWKVLPIR